MAKRRSKKQKIKAQQKRQAQLPVMIKARERKKIDVGLSSTTTQTRETRKKSTQLQDKLLGFDINLIKKDLLKTGMVSFVIMIIIAALYFWL